MQTFNKTRVGQDRLFDPVNLGGIKLKNRMVRSATWEGMAAPDGSMPPELLDEYERLAAGGIGGIITGFTSVANNDRYFDGMARLSSDALVQNHRELVKRVHSHGVPVMAQLALGAYYNETGRQVEPDQMNPEQIADVVRLFSQAARRAQEAGYDGVQIHVAHWFFLSRFVSPAHNHRTDAYGGSLQGRARLAIQVIAAVHAAAPKLHVSAKVNSDDFSQGGLDERQALELDLLLAKAGLDSIEVSGNGTSVGGVRPHHGEGYFLPFAAELAERTNVPVIAVGGWRSPDLMEEALEKTKVAALSLSRPLVREPELPLRWEQGDLRPALCVSCNMCYQTPCHQCIFNLRKRA